MLNGSYHIQDNNDSLDGRTHFIHEVNYNLFVSGGRYIRRRNTCIGFRVTNVAEAGTTVMVADAVCRDSTDNYNHQIGREIVSNRLNYDGDVRRRYEFQIPHITKLPTNFNEWRELEHAVAKAVQYHNNRQENRKNAVFLSGYTVPVDLRATAGDRADLA